MLERRLQFEADLAELPADGGEVKDVNRAVSAQRDQLRAVRREAAVARHQDIGGLEVAVDDPLLVGMLHRLADVDE